VDYVCTADVQEEEDEKQNVCILINSRNEEEKYRSPYIQLLIYYTGN